MSETVEITRYPNRRLYDRSRKKYVTVGQIEAMVLGGQDVRVRDSKSNEDLTRVVLTQIILERHPERMKMFPVPCLHAILRADQMALNWLTLYFGQAMSFMERAMPSSSSSVMPSMDFWQSLLPGAKNATNKPPTSETRSYEDGNEDPEAGSEAAQQDMAAKLTEMERRLKQLEGGSAVEPPSGDG